MSVAHALIGFIIGQIITLEGIRLGRLIMYLLSLLLVGLFTVLPVFSLIYMVHGFQLQSNPVLILSISMILTEGIRSLLYFVDPMTCHRHDIY